MAITHKYALICPSVCFYPLAWCGLSLSSVIFKLHHFDLPDCELVKIPHFHQRKWHHPIVTADKKQRCISNEESAFGCSFSVKMRLCSTVFIQHVHICMHAVVQHVRNRNTKLVLENHTKLIADTLGRKNNFLCTCGCSSDVENGNCWGWKRLGKSKKK